MAANQRQHDRRLVIGIEVGPVHGDNNIRARPDRMGNPSFREFVDVNSRVREQPVHLLDGVFWQPARANASPCPIVFTAREALLTTPSVAFANEEILLA